jgi:hypothetical protein
MKNERILQNLAPNALAFGGGAAFLHPNDVVRVVDKLKKLETRFYDDAHSTGSVHVFDQEIEWSIQPNEARPVLLHLK